MSTQKSTKSGVRKTKTIELEAVVVGRDKKPVRVEDVFRLAAMGCKDTEIADWHGIDTNTLRYNFSVELVKGRESLKQSLRKKQIDVALQGNVTMLIWLGKNILGQSDTSVDAEANQPLPWDSVE